MGQHGLEHRFGAMANMNITRILEKMTGKDKDYRYMATSDLLNELNKESFKADQDLESKLTNIVLQQLEDASRDVSGLAVKWEPHLEEAASTYPPRPGQMAPWRLTSGVASPTDRPVSYLTPEVVGEAGERAKARSGRVLQCSG
ncbi:Cullin-associated NEDD8-dissociated protein 1 [Hordeum vulgare]|nr:Cullin-associated NEDD8-dissociated protein 1 [Hordeum vulgare]